jgi:hypothetical protein
LRGWKKLKFLKIFNFRTHEIPTNVSLVASGPFEGIIINKLVEHYEG